MDILSLLAGVVTTGIPGVFAYRQLKVSTSAKLKEQTEEQVAKAQKDLREYIDQKWHKCEEERAEDRNKYEDAMETQRLRYMALVDETMKLAELVGRMKRTLAYHGIVFNESVNLQQTMQPARLHDSAGEIKLPPAPEAVTRQESPSVP